MTSFVGRPGEWCKGSNDHRMKKPTRSSCESACVRARCACFAYRSTDREDNCRFTLASEFQQTQRSKVGFDAYLRSDVADGALYPSIQPQQRTNLGGPCGADSGASLKQGTGRSAVRPFFMYTGPPALGDPSALIKCYTSRNKGMWPWASDKAGSGHLASEPSARFDV